MNIDDALLLIREIPDYPKPGIRFQDITPLLAHGEAFIATTEKFASFADSSTLVAGIEARGFIFASAVANQLHSGFIPIRKAGKLPHLTISESYGLEYGVDTLEVHIDAVPKGAKVLLIDDVQFICNKDQTQEAFFHIFNSLYDQQKQIVFTCDQYPRDMNGLTDIDSILLANLYFVSCNCKGKRYELARKYLTSKINKTLTNRNGKPVKVLSLD